MPTSVFLLLIALAGSELGLKEYNFDEASIEWIQSYLGDRKQCVKIESKTSDLLDCDESGANKVQY